MFYEKISQYRQLYRKWKTFQKIPDNDWANKLVEFNISLSQIQFEPESHKLYFEPLDISLVKRKHDFLLSPKIVNYAKSLKRIAKASFYIDKNNDLMIEIDGIKLIIETAQDICILQEIFLLGSYNFIYRRPISVIDIGMHTGFASLYFANQDWVHSVWGYEPFKPTYEQALRNFKLNPDIAQKIHPYQYGIGEQAESLTVDYDYSIKGSIGVDGIEQNSSKGINQKGSLPKEEIKIKPISDVLDTIIAQSPSTEIVAKIDCEGSEYGILKSLNSTGQLQRLKVIMMEWHKQGPELLVDYLSEAGFVIFSRLPKSRNVGMLYAVKV